MIEGGTTDGVLVPAHLYKLRELWRSAGREGGTMACVCLWVYRREGGKRGRKRWVSE